MHMNTKERKIANNFNTQTRLALTILYVLLSGSKEDVDEVMLLCERYIGFCNNKCWHYTFDHRAECVVRAVVSYKYGLDGTPFEYGREKASFDGVPC